MIYYSKVFYYLFPIFFTSAVVAQEKLEVAGAITLGPYLGNGADAGTIQWNGVDFLVWDGESWRSITQGVTYAGTVEDVDGNTYQTVQIGNQDWMAENLRTTKYRDGSAISYITVNLQWSADIKGAFSWYTHSPGLKFPYGGLYNGFAIQSSHELCPTGWEVPDDTDWDELFNFLEGNVQNDVGGKLKEKRTAHWNSPNNQASNIVGFSALPGGLRSAAGVFSGLGEYGRFWSRTENSGLLSAKYMWNLSPELVGSNFDMNTGLSVRCIKK